MSKQKGPYQTYEKEQTMSENSKRLITTQNSGGKISTIKSSVTNIISDESKVTTSNGQTKSNNTEEFKQK